MSIVLRSSDMGLANNVLEFRLNRGCDVFGSIVIDGEDADGGLTPFAERGLTYDAQDVRRLARGGHGVPNLPGNPFLPLICALRPSVTLEIDIR